MLILLRFPAEFATAMVEAADFDSQIGVFSAPADGLSTASPARQQRVPEGWRYNLRRTRLSVPLADLEDAELP